MWPTPANLARTKTILLLGVLGIVALMVYLRIAPSGGGKSEPVVGKVTKAEEPKAAKGVPRKTVPAPSAGVVVYDKIKLSGTLKMPEIEKEPGLPVAVASVPAHRGPTTAVAMLDNTGETRILTRAEPPPFFEWRKEWVGNGRYLFVGDHLAEVDLEHRPFRLNARDGRLTIEPYAFGGIDIDRDDNDLGARAGLGVQIKF